MRWFKSRLYLPAFTDALYDGPLPEEWIETVSLDLDSFLLEPGTGTAFRLGATVAVVAQDSDHSPEDLMRYIVRDLAERLDAAALCDLHDLLAGL